jgi:ketosteroid isomerase-like protein
MSTTGNRDVARTALEQVCARGDMRLAGDCYAPTSPTTSAPCASTASTASAAPPSLYRALVTDLTITVTDQVTDGDQVASRWTLTGTNRGRPVHLTGITISRLRDARIVEDWTAFDSLDLLRALGLRRTLHAAPRLLRALLQGRRTAH